MIPDALRRVLRPAVRGLRRRFGPDRFLRQVDGVIHVGANSGGERDEYEALGLDVLWIEPIPEICARLRDNIRGLSRQRAVMALVTDVVGKEYEFHVSSNEGASSSILDLARHRDLWPEVGYARSIMVTSTTLPEVLAAEGVDPRGYQALVLDTQGSELLVLRGAEPILGGFDYVKAEAADFEAYAGGCQVSDLTAFMVDHGFREIRRTRFFGRPGIGNYYDLVFQRR